MKFTKTMAYCSAISVTALITSLSPNTAQAFPFSGGNPNSGSSACYHNDVFYGMAWGGAPCPDIPIDTPDHKKYDENGNVLATFKHDPISCVIVETPFND